ncbi:MAG: serine/threonine protein kinase [Planctomycetes bacterium]|nr:serine/threonine protein kinase [Planctomycetota bacterium]
MTDTPVTRWRSVRALFEQVADLQPAERDRVLDAQCAGDAGLRADVDRLLRADVDSGVLLTPTRIGATPGGIDPLGDEAAGTRIGAFTVRRRIGIGGMGAVYEAEQDQPRRLVAIKVLRPELCSGETLRRFEVEAEILARLQHPGIAEVYAAGVHETRSGPFRLVMPYYAMELMSGALPITAYASRHAIPLAGRLALIAAVCAAVHHAHQRGVIHRDLKPGNALVDERGVVKVIDFGVARAASSELTHTLPGVVIGTPNYMAPEQALGRDVDVRSDVWALGVILYELICGRLPFEVTAPTPSAFANPPTAPHRITGAASRELTWIVMRALAVEPARRYQSAAELGGDLARLQRGDPVQAAPPSLGYTLRKAMRRHRTLTAAAAVGLLTALAGLVSTATALRRAWQAEADALQAAGDAKSAAEQARRAAAEADAERHSAERAKENAERARATAEQASAVTAETNQQLTGLMAIIQSAVAAASRAGRGRDVTLAQLWTEVEARVTSDSTAPALTRAATFNFLGAIRFHSADFPAAERLFRRSLDTLPETGTHSERARILGHASLSEALRLQQRQLDSERELGRALELAEHLLPAEDTLRLSLQRRVAFAYLNRGDTDQALKLCRAILAARLAAKPTDPRACAEAQSDLASALLVAGKVAECVTAAQRALELCGPAFGDGHAKTGNAAYTLASALRRAGRHPEARAAAQRGLTACTSTLGSTHLITRALRLRLAQARQHDGELEPAIAELDSLLAELRGDRLADRRHRLGAANALGEALLAAGRAQQAVDAMAPDAADLPGAPRPVQVELATLQSTHARALIAAGRTDRARELLGTAAANAAKRLGSNHPAAKRLATQRDELRGRTPPR